MFHLTLLPALAAPAFAPVPATSLQGELSKALPGDAAMVALFGDMHAVCNSEDAGRWAKMLRDPRWRELWQELTLQLANASDPDADAEEASHAIALVIDSMRGTHGGAIASLDPVSGRMVGVLKVDEGWLAETVARIAEGGETFEPVDALGGKAYIGGETEWMSTLVVERSGHVVFALDVDLEAATASAGGVLEGLAAPATDEEPWWLAASNRAPGAEIELFLDGEKIAENVPELQEMTASIGALQVMHLAFDFGAADAAEAWIDVRVGGGPIMDTVAGLFVKADPGLLKHTPSGYTGSVVGLDFAAMIEATLSMAVAESGGDPSTAFDDAIGAINGMLGIDFEADFIDQLTGQTLLAQPETNFEALVAAESGEDLPMDAMAPVLAFQVADTDAVLEVVEAIVGTIEGQGLVVESSDIAGSAVWMADPGIGATIAVSLGRGFIAIGVEDSVAALANALAAPDAQHAVSTDMIQALAPELDGVMVTIAPVEAALSALETLVDLAGSADDTENPDLDALTIEAFETALTIAREHLAGVMAGELHVTPNGMTYRIFTR